MRTSRKFTTTIGVAVSVCVALFASTAFAYEPSALHKSWKALSSEWTELTRQRMGQVCDPWRSVGDVEYPEDLGDGCVVLWISDPWDNFTVGNLPLNQQDDFLNTQHYKSAFNFHGYGLMAEALPMAPQYLNPVCYIVRANDTGVLSLGYEEGDGSGLQPCPGHDGGIPWTEEQIMSAANDYEKLQDMCNQCYQAVCTNEGSSNPQECGQASDGELQVGTGSPLAYMVQQATPSYHCHLTMRNEGACDYVQYVQHESSREYNGTHGVYCGWEKVRDLNVTLCDCTLRNGQNNGCGQNECLSMAEKGVACGNCNNCNQNDAYEAIFAPIREDEPFWGWCSAVRNLRDSGKEEVEDPHDELYKARYMCSRALFCRDEGDNVFSLANDNCKEHCEMFPLDPRCPLLSPATRRLLEVSTADALTEEQLDGLQVPEGTEVIRSIKMHHRRMKM